MAYKTPKFPFVDPFAFPPAEPMWQTMDFGCGPEPYVLVVDPATRKLCIPLRAVAPTQALHRMDRVPSICMLSMQGRCRQGSACHQLHADPIIVDMLRADVNLRASCCPAHGEEVTQPSLVELDRKVATVVVDGLRVPAARISTTNGMRRLMADRMSPEKRNPLDTDTAVHTTRAQVCRLHVQGRCRYAEDCNFVHICRGLTDGEDVELTKMLAAAVTATPSKTARSLSRSFGTPSSAFVGQMPPSPLYAATPSSHSPVVGVAPLSLDSAERSGETTPPSTPALNRSITTPTQGPWRHEPYNWQCVSPVRH